jgi:hypothetical protein
MNTHTIDKVAEPNKELKHKIASAIFAVVIIATGGLTLETSAPALAAPEYGECSRVPDRGDYFDQEQILEKTTLLPRQEALSTST